MLTKLYFVNTFLLYVRNSIHQATIRKIESFKFENNNPQETLVCSKKISLPTPAK